MNIPQRTFYAIGKQFWLGQDQLNGFWKDLEIAESYKGASRLVTFLYMLGSIVFFCWTPLFIGFVREEYNAFIFSIITCIFVVIFYRIGESWWEKPELRIAGGISFTFGVLLLSTVFHRLVEPIIAGILPIDSYGVHSVLTKPDIITDILTLITGVLTLRHYPFAFMIVPLFCSAWSIFYAVVNTIIGSHLGLNPEMWINLWFGAGLTCLGYVLDRCELEDFGFWAYLCGTVLFSMYFDSPFGDLGEIGELLSQCILFGMMIAGIKLNRKILLILPGLCLCLHAGVLPILLVVILVFVRLSYPSKGAQAVS